MANSTEKLKLAFEEFVLENEKFEGKGNKAAGTRARKALQEIRTLAFDRRKEITDSKNS